MIEDGFIIMIHNIGCHQIIESRTMKASIVKISHDFQSFSATVDNGTIVVFSVLGKKSLKLNDILTGNMKCCGKKKLLLNNAEEVTINIDEIFSTQAPTNHSGSIK